MVERNSDVSTEVLKECINRMILARTSLMLGHPFFGVLASRLRPVPNNTWCRTMAVDGKHLFYNVEFVMGLQDQSKREEYAAKLRAAIPDITDEQVESSLNGLSDQNLIAVICHEILHCAYDHFLRRGNRDPKAWNVAADYAINQIIVRDKIGQIQDSWLFDKKFDGMTAEEIYAILLEEAQKNKGDGEGDGDGDGDDGQGQGQGGSGPGKGEFRGTFGGGTVDQHDIPDEGKATDAEGNPIDGDKRREYMEDFKTAMMNAARAGNAPAEIQRMIKDFQEPKIDWRSKLHRTLRSWMKSDASFTNPNRRSWSTGFGTTGTFYGNPIFPGLKPDEDIDIAIALDASGSISEAMLKDFIGEVLGITKQFKQYKIRIMTFDTQVYTVRDYKTGEEKKILEYPIHGGGGTDFLAVWEHMKEDNYKPKQLIMFTDGEPWNSWGDPDYCKTLFVIHSNPRKEAPFGETVHYEWEAKKARA
ncbi:VWA domain-containing protein [Salmonella enterica]|nr:VWA domain-containing protein [Salmonella enterica]